MTKLYITDSTPLHDSRIIEQLLPRFDTVRQKKIHSLQILEKQAQSAAAGLLLNHLFGATATYQYTLKGKPYLADKACYFSISHSHQWVSIAVSDTEIGADIQTVSPIRPAVLRRVFTEDEQRYIGEDTVRFTELWTKKEAYAKYTGAGMAAQLAAPISNMPFCTDRYADTVYTICGDDAVQVISVNIKDLL